MERPVLRERDMMEVTMKLDFQQVLDMDEKNQMLTTVRRLRKFLASIPSTHHSVYLQSLWLQLNWIDQNLVWDPNEYDNITDIRIHPSKLWKPDIILYNSADSRFDTTYQVRFSMYSVHHICLKKCQSTG